MRLLCIALLCALCAESKAIVWPYSNYPPGKLPAILVVGAPTGSIDVLVNALVDVGAVDGAMKGLKTAWATEKMFERGLWPFLRRRNVCSAQAAWKVANEETAVQICDGTRQDEGCRNRFCDLHEPLRAGTPEIPLDDVLGSLKVHNASIVGSAAVLPYWEDILPRLGKTNVVVVVLESSEEVVEKDILTEIRTLQELQLGTMSYRQSAILGDAVGDPRVVRYPSAEILPSSEGLWWSRLRDLELEVIGMKNGPKVLRVREEDVFGGDGLKELCANLGEIWGVDKACPKLGEFSGVGEKPKVSWTVMDPMQEDLGFGGPWLQKSTCAWNDDYGPKPEIHSPTALVLLDNRIFKSVDVLMEMLAALWSARNLSGWVKATSDAWFMIPERDVPSAEERKEVEAVLEVFNVRWIPISDLTMCREKDDPMAKSVPFEWRVATSTSASRCAPRKNYAKLWFEPVEVAIFDRKLQALTLSALGYSHIYYMDGDLYDQTSKDAMWSAPSIAMHMDAERLVQEFGMGAMDLRDAKGWKTNMLKMAPECSKISPDVGLSSDLINCVAKSRAKSNSNAGNFAPSRMIPRPDDIPQTSEGALIPDSALAYMFGTPNTYMQGSSIYFRLGQPRHCPLVVDANEVAHSHLSPYGHFAGGGQRYVDYDWKRKIIKRQTYISGQPPKHVFTKAEEHLVEVLTTAGVGTPVVSAKPSGSDHAMNPTGNVNPSSKIDQALYHALYAGVYRTLIRHPSVNGVFGARHHGGSSQKVTTWNDKKIKSLNALIANNKDRKGPSPAQKDGIVRRTFRCLARYIASHPDIPESFKEKVAKLKWNPPIPGETDAIACIDVSASSGQFFREPIGMGSAWAACHNLDYSQLTVQDYLQVVDEGAKGSYLVPQTQCTNPKECLKGLKKGSSATPLDWKSLAILLPTISNASTPYDTPLFRTKPPHALLADLQLSCIAIRVAKWRKEHDKL